MIFIPFPIIGKRKQNTFPKWDMIVPFWESFQTKWEFFVQKILCKKILNSLKNFPTWDNQIPLCESILLSFAQYWSFILYLKKTMNFIG